MISCSTKKQAPNFTCTGYDGSSIWQELHKIHEKIDCGHCADHAKFLMTAIHDHVNAGLGKQVFDSKNYHWFVKEVNSTFDHAKKHRLII